MRGLGEEGSEVRSTSSIEGGVFGIFDVVNGLGGRIFNLLELTEREAN